MDGDPLRQFNQWAVMKKSTYLALKSTEVTAALQISAKERVSSGLNEQLGDVVEERFKCNSIAKALRDLSWVEHSSGTASRLHVMELRCPTQHQRIDAQRARRIEDVKTALKKFDPAKIGPSLANVARAACKVDAKPLREARKRPREPEENADENADAQEGMLNMPEQIATRL